MSGVCGVVRTGKAGGWGRRGGGPSKGGERREGDRVGLGGLGCGWRFGAEVWGSGAVVGTVVWVTPAEDAAAGSWRRGVGGVSERVAGCVRVVVSDAALPSPVSWSRVTVKSLGRAVEVEVSVSGSMGWRGCG